MNIIDIILLLLLAAGAWKGFRNGFVIELVSLISFIAGIVIAFTFMNAGAVWLSEQIEMKGSWLLPLSFILLFIAVLVGLRFLSRLLKKTLDLTPLGYLDDIGGGMVGALKTAFGLSLLIWVLDYLSIDFLSSKLEKSQIHPYLAPIAPLVLDWFSGFFPTIKEFFSQPSEPVQV